jgi:tripartite-type tricarboxylate transporter receptor subunit TctC
MKTVRTGAILNGVLIAAMSMSGVAAAQGWPQKPVRMVVAYAAGGSNDVIARYLGQRLTAQTGQQVIVENRPGAGSNIGSDFVAKAAPDGYTLLMGSSANAVNASLYTVMPYNPLKDIAAVTLVGTSPNVLVVHPSLPVRTVKEFITLAKGRPGAITFASSGTGGAMHLSGELFKVQGGVDILHVPYKGGGPAVIDLLGGHVSVMFDNLITAIPNIRSEKVRALGVTTTQRAAQLPSVPTISESGLPGYDAFVWWGVFAPGGTPPDLVGRMQAELSKAIRAPEMLEKLREQGIATSGGTAKEFDAFFRADAEKWARVVKAAGIKAE